MILNEYLARIFRLIQKVSSVLLTQESCKFTRSFESLVTREINYRVHGATPERVCAQFALLDDDEDDYT